MTVVRFPGGDGDNDAMRGLVDDAHEKLRTVADEVMAELSGIEDRDLDALYDSTGAGSFRTVEDALFFELLTSEVDRRCAAKNVSCPWDDETEIRTAANDDPDDGVA